MRDIVMVAVFLLLLVPALKKPFIAVSLWLWSAMFYPNGWVYGIGQSVHYNLVFSLLGLWFTLFQSDRPKLENNALTGLITFFLLWATLCYLLGIGNPDAANLCWSNFVKTVALYYCASLILTQKNHIDFFIWCIVLSVGFYACVEGLKLVASGGVHQISGIEGHVLGDRNDLALAIVMSIPLTVYLRGQVESKTLKLGLLGCIILMVLCVLGTYSRGGLLGLIVLGIFFFKESNNKLMAILALLVIVFLGSNLMPDAWFERMDTIQNAEDDLSFMGRVVAWKISYLMALDRPIIGGGMKALETYAVWIEYAPQLRDKLTFIDTPPPDYKAAHAAHSIYFQVLGDEGFIGLILFLSTLFVGYKKLVKCTRKFELKTPFHTLSKMLKLSVIVYMVVGIALSRAYFDLLYAVYILIRVLERQADASATEN